MTRTPVALITGFLGSGKTTLVNRLLAHPGMADTAVVVNEFGEIGLDHDLIAASDDAIVLLANGCVCCAVRGDLVRTLDELHRRRAGGTLPPFARVIVETSGLADPGPVIQALLAEPTLRARYALGAVVALVDAVNGSATLDAHFEAVKQAAVADRIVITKLDLAPADASLAALRGRLAALNPGADIVEGSAGLDPKSVFAVPLPESAPSAQRVAAWLRVEHYAGRMPGAIAGSDHRHDASVRSFCIVRDEPLAEGTLRLFMDALAQNLGPALLRVKGIVHVAQRPDTPAVLHGAQALLHDVAWLERWPNADRRTRLVFVTLEHTRDAMEDLLDTVQRFAAGAARARATAGRA